MMAAIRIELISVCPLIIIAVSILYKIEFKPVLPLNYTAICISGRLAPTARQKGGITNASGYWY